MTTYIPGVPLTVLKNGVMCGLPIFGAAVVSDPTFRALLREVEVLLAVDLVTRAAVPLYGDEHLQQMLPRSFEGTPIKTKLVALEYTPGTDELDRLAAITRECKGTCDLITPAGPNPKN